MENLIFADFFKKKRNKKFQLVCCDICGQPGFTSFVNIYSFGH